MEEQDQLIVMERMDALADAEAETARQLNERIDDLEGKVEKQSEVLGLISRSIGSIGSTM
jgi:tetrahydromethanopterin S-methyltransferase subunit G